MPSIINTYSYSRLNLSSQSCERTRISKCKRQPLRPSHQRRLRKFSRNAVRENSRFVYLSPEFNSFRCEYFNIYRFRRQMRSVRRANRRWTNPFKPPRNVRCWCVRMPCTRMSCQVHQRRWPSVHRCAPFRSSTYRWSNNRQSRPWNATKKKTAWNRNRSYSVKRWL